MIFKPTQLTPKQARWLKDLAAGRKPARHYRPDSGGPRSIRTSLRRAGLLHADGRLADAGRVALANHVVLAPNGRRR